MKKTKYLLTKTVNSIHFWITLFLIIRLFGITDPPLEGAENWRQTTGIMIYKNLYYDTPNVFYPKLDCCGDQIGITACEFPCLPYLSYLTAKIFGFQDWYGRLINLLITSIGIFFFYRIIKVYFTKQHAFYSALLLLSSIWFMYGRKSMPDTFSLSLAFISVYYGIQYFRSSKWLYLLLYLTIGAFGILSKIPAILPFCILLFPFFSKESNNKQRILFASSSLIILSVVYIWYYQWLPYLLTEYKFEQFFLGTDFKTGLLELVQYWPGTLEAFYFNAFEGFTASALFILGLFALIKAKDKRMLYPFLVLSLFNLIFMLKSGWTFSSHSYYIIPFTPVMAWLAAYFLINIKYKKLVIILLAAASIEGIANQQHDLFIRKSECYKLEFNSFTNQVSSKDDLFATNGSCCPQQMYFLGRKGWTYNTNDFNSPERMSYLKAHGCKFIFINKRNGQANIDLPKVFENEDVVIYGLNSLDK